MVNKDKETAAVQEQPKKVERKRVPFGIPRAKLTVSNQIQGFHLHWVNDEGGRIYQAQQGGYELVTPQEVGDESTETSVKRLVGKQEDGSGLFAYLMKIRQDWYEEDQKASQEIQDQFDAAIKKGTLEQTPGDQRYIPKEGISIRS